MTPSQTIKIETNSAKVGIAADIVAGITLISIVPYELGDLGVVVPPQIKPYVVAAGILATVILRLYKRWQELRTAKEGT